MQSLLEFVNKNIFPSRSAETSFDDMTTRVTNDIKRDNTRIRGEKNKEI